MAKQIVWWFSEEDRGVVTGGEISGWKGEQRAERERMAEEFGGLGGCVRCKRGADVVQRTLYCSVVYSNLYRS